MYKVKFGGKRGKSFQLVESPNMVVIRTVGNQDLESLSIGAESQAFINQSTEVLGFPEAGVSVRRLLTPPQQNLSMALSRRDSMRAVLKQEEDIRFAGRVLQNPETGAVTLYTENFFVKFKDKLSPDACTRIIAEYGLSIKRKLPFATNAYFVEAAEGTGLKVFEIAEKLLAEKQVDYCHPELIQERQFKAIHPLQWHLAPTRINNTHIDAHVNIEQAWQVSKGQGVTIAVIDDGLDLAHPEFEGRIVAPFDATENSDDPRPKDPKENHGTSCAGMACAAGLPNGASGTAPEANLMPIRLRSGLGSMNEANAFVWAADHGADVISCSWGPRDGAWWDDKDPIHQEVQMLPDHTRLAIEYAINEGRGGKGCVILFAAGNGNENILNDGYASFPGVIAVAACNEAGKRAVYSDFGPAVWACFPSNDFGHSGLNHPAPISSGLRTTDRLLQDGYETGDYTDTFGGTSGACPGLAGVVGLMLSVNPDLSSSEVKDLIRRSCVRIDPETGAYDAHGHSNLYGYGRIDAGLAIRNALPVAHPEIPNITGSVRFTVLGELPLSQNSITGGFTPSRKVLGLRLALENPVAGLALKYRVNVPELGILENSEPGGYIGVGNARQRIVGFSVYLEGSAASNYEVEYAGRFKGQQALELARNGAICGGTNALGKTLEGITVRIHKKGA
jgi:subtilisin family serine protease